MQFNWIQLFAFPLYTFSGVLPESSHQPDSRRSRRGKNCKVPQKYCLNLHLYLNNLAPFVISMHIPITDVL